MNRLATLRKKRLWTVADFATFMGDDFSAYQAREMLRRWDEESGGTLLVKSRGSNRRFMFAPARLLKLHPEIFDCIESLETRVEELEEGVADIRSAQKRIVSQVGQNTRDIAKQSAQLSLFRRSA